MITEFLVNPIVLLIVSAAVIITAIIKQVSKDDTGIVNKKVERFLPLISFGTAVILTLIALLPEITVINAGEVIIACILVGGAGSGNYDLVKQAILGK